MSVARTSGRKVASKNVVEEEVDMSPQIPNAVELPGAVLATPTEAGACDLSVAAIMSLRLLARTDAAALDGELTRLGITAHTRRDELKRSLGVRIGIVCMTKHPVNIETWLAYHTEVLGAERIYLRIEDTPELADMLSLSPWDSLVEPKFAANTSTDWVCNRRSNSDV